MDLKVCHGRFTWPPIIGRDWPLRRFRAGSSLSAQRTAEIARCNLGMRYALGMKL
jgi:hypothetical protein